MSFFYLKTKLQVILYSIHNKIVSLIRSQGRDKENLRKLISAHYINFLGIFECKALYTMIHV